MTARPVQRQDSFEAMFERCCDKYELMPQRKKEELVLKVLMVAAAAGILSLIVFPVAPLVALLAGFGAFLYFTDEYTPGEFIGDVYNNPREYMNRANDPSFRFALQRRVAIDGGYAIKNFSTSIQSWLASCFS